MITVRGFITFATKLLLLCASLCVLPASAWERDDRLALMAADLLPAILGAQQSMAEFYHVDADDSAKDSVKVLVVYKKKAVLADKVIKRMSELQAVKNIRLQAKHLNDKQYAQYLDSATAEELDADIVFIIDELGKPLERLVSLSHRHGIVTYSSNAKHLAKGVALGLSVTEQVRPAIHSASLKALNMKFSALFMRIAVELP